MREMVVGFAFAHGLVYDTSPKTAPKEGIVQRYPKCPQPQQWYSHSSYSNSPGTDNWNKGLSNSHTRIMFPSFKIKVGLNNVVLLL